MSQVLMEQIQFESIEAANRFTLGWNSSAPPGNGILNIGGLVGLPSPGKGFRSKIPGKIQ